MCKKKTHLQKAVKCYNNLFVKKFGNCGLNLKQMNKKASLIIYLTFTIGLICRPHKICGCTDWACVTKVETSGWLVRPNWARQAQVFQNIKEIPCSTRN